MSVKGAYIALPKIFIGSLSMTILPMTFLLYFDFWTPKTTVICFFQNFPVANRTLTCMVGKLNLLATQTIKIRVCTRVLGPEIELEKLFTFLFSWLFLVLSTWLTFVELLVLIFVISDPNLPRLPIFDSTGQFSRKIYFLKREISLNRTRIFW